MAKCKALTGSAVKRLSTELSKSLFMCYAFVVAGFIFLTHLQGQGLDPQGPGQG